METEYAGTLSTLTKYGTLNVSAVRIPRKKRSRGNVTKPRTSGAASECISYFNADKSDATIFRTVKSAPRKYNRTPRRYTEAPHRITAADLAPIGNVE